jgi:hypothetical protein
MSRVRASRPSTGTFTWARRWLDMLPASTSFWNPERDRRRAPSRRASPRCPAAKAAQWPAAGFGAVVAQYVGLWLSRGGKLADMWAGLRTRRPVRAPCRCWHTGRPFTCTRCARVNPSVAGWEQRLLSRSLIPWRGQIMEHRSRSRRLCNLWDQVAAQGMER